MGADALEVADKYPGCDIPYIALTRDSCERIIWKALLEFIAKHKLPYKAIESELKIKTPKGSTIFLLGADQRNFIERLRGGKFPAAYIDEAGAFKDAIIKPLVEEILDACVSDYNGKIVLSGTPGPVPRGYFYEATKKMHGFTSHSWSVLDNPFLPHVTNEWLDERLKRKGQTRENPTFRREWLGEWVEDPDALVYKYRKGRNDLKGDIPRDAIAILAIDFGWHDQTAFGVVLYHPQSPKIWIRHVEGHSHMTPSEISIRATQLQAKFGPAFIVADTGGLGKSIAEEMKRRWGLPVHAVEKKDKQTWIRVMNGDFIDGNIEVHPDCQEYIDQVQKLEKDEKGQENPDLPNDLCDVALYGFRHAYAYAYKPEMEPPQSEAEKFALKEKEWLEKEERIARELQREKELY